MANEYLKRQPTSSGNSRRWTVSFWMKNSDPTQGYTAIMGAGKPSPTNVYNEIFYNGSQTGLNLDKSSDPDNYNIIANPLLRDPSSWMHVVVSFTDQGDNANTRVKFYINGAFTDHNTGTNLDVSETSFFNDPEYIHYIGSRAQQSYGGTTFDAQYFDVFLVDGQALTADVFGFYKEGKGYQSSGSSDSTDFGPGQWSPHSPRKIKTEIERKGGFGVNGFYLPMNDSSNVGADFHTTPNSIIKLKGEDLPQPRNGAPTTSDAFVSQLRQETGSLGFDGVVAFDGNGDYLSIPSSGDFALGTGDWTIEYFAYPTSTTQYQRHFYLIGSNANQIEGIFANSSGISFGKTNVWAPTQVSHPLYRWNHYALVHDSTNMRLYINGNQVLTSTDNFANENKSLHIGYSNSTFGGYFTGFMSNFRVVKGTALYTSNFTPPTEPLTNVTNTKLLCCNSSTSATAATVTPGTITANGGAFATRNELSGSIVLAVPGISTATGPNLITNGHFDSNVSNWTATNCTTAWENGQMKVTRSGGTGLTANQAFTTVSGERYTITGTINSSGSRGDLRVYDGSGVSGSMIVSLTGTNGAVTDLKGSFTASSTTSTVVITIDNNGTVVYADNIVVKQEDAPRDYSADIKGSGTNKTFTPNGQAGIVYETDGYYGSSMKFDGTGDYIRTTSNLSDFHFGSGDFTIEAWTWKDANGSSNYDGLISLGTNGNANDGFFFEVSATRGYFFGSNSQFISYNSSSNTSQWNHVVAERYNGRSTIYLNGVAVATGTNVGSIPTNGTVLDIGGYAIGAGNYYYNGYIQDLRVYKGVAKYKGGFDVPKPYTPVGIESWRQVSDTCKNNFATLNSISGNESSGQFTLSDGNLTASTTGSNASVTSNFGMSSGKWYWEYCPSGIENFHDIGISHLENPPLGFDDGTLSASWRTSTGQIRQGNTNVQATGLSASEGDIVQIAFDADTRKMWVGVNGSYFGGADPATGTNTTYQTNLTADRYFFAASLHQSGTTNTHTGIANFGQNPTFSGTKIAGTNTDSNGKGLFKYQPPTGFLALCEDNLPTPAIADPGEHFKTVLYRGDGNTGHSITGVEFQPDLVWLKERTSTSSHQWHDSVRGAGNVLISNVTNAESYAATYLYSLDSDGFTLGTSGGVNASTDDYVAWCWKAGGATVSNTDGTITSQVSANQTAGFSIVSYTGNATDSTVGHGLNKTPGFIIVKKRNGASDWPVYHHSLATQEYLVLNLTNAKNTTTELFYQDPTSSVFYIGDASNAINASGGTYIAYCWAEIEGFSKFGSYVGNSNADGSFVYCGFKPAWVMIKVATTTNSWVIYDSSRSSTNIVNNRLRANLSNVEDTHNGVDFLSNGFKLRDAGLNPQYTKDPSAFELPT